MADGDFQSEGPMRKYAEQGEPVRLDVTSSEDEEEEGPGQVVDVDQNEDKEHDLMQNFMREELAQQLIQQDLQLSFNRQLPIHTTAKAFEEKINSVNKTSSKDSAPSLVSKQQERQRNFLVAQLVELNESQPGSDQFQQQHRQRLFKDNLEQEGSLLAKLMHERNLNPDGHSHRLDLGGASDEARGRQIGPSSQMDDSQKSQIKQLETGAVEQRSRSTSSGNSFADDQLRMRSIDLDEHVKLVDLFGIQIVALTINGKERLCLAQISNTLLKEFSYNEIHNRRVALGITCVQCTPIQLEMLRRAGAMPSSSRRCGMITMREAERLCKSFLAEEQPPELPENFYFTVAHRVNYGCRGRFVPARYISSRAKCIECFTCGDFFSPNKFIFHSHKDSATTDCNPPDSPNINSWRKHINLDLTHEHSQEIKYAWEDVKSLFNGGTRRRTTLGGGGGSLSSCAGDHHQAGLRLNSPDESEAGQKPSAEDNQGSKGLCRGSTLTAQQHNQQATVSNGSRNEALAKEITRNVEQARTPRMQTLSQNERRKLPIGSWSRDRRPATQGGEYHIQTVTPLKRSPGQSHDSLAHQHHVVKRMTLHNDWQQQQQHKLATSKISAASQSLAAEGQASSSLYQHEQAFHLDPMRTQQHIATTGLSGLGDFKVGPASVHNQAGGRSVPADSLAEPSQTPTNVDSSMSTAGTLLYSQLYSQLMQSQLAHQVDHRSHQQHQMATLEAQMALRQHFWSSLLANLRPQSQVQLDQTQISGQLFKTNHLADYCLANPDDQQQTSSLLAAAAAAAAVASTSITSPSSNSFGGHHQGGITEMGQLKNLGMRAPNTSSNLMHLYATNARANTSDTAAIFNGGNDNC